MRYSTAEEFYCPDPDCEGWDGVLVRWYPDTLTEPGEWSTDTCPHCGRRLDSKHPDTETMLDMYLGAMEEETTDSEVPGPEHFGVWHYDSVEVYRVVLRELRRQDRERA